MKYKIVIHTTAESSARDDGYVRGAGKYYWCIVDDHEVTVASGWSETTEKAFEAASVAHQCVISGNWAAHTGEFSSDLK